MVDFTVKKCYNEAKGVNDVYGYATFHESLMQNLIENARTGNVSHAYIFEGAKGMYKHESAKLFAAALTCTSQKNAPCGMCKKCIESAANSNPDIIFIEKPEKKTVITADVIRDITEDVIIKPFDSPHKVYIVNDGNIMNETAQNAFLKTFEEPPEYAVFIIIVENSEYLLQTIRSRAVTISFPPVSDSIISDMIDKKYPQRHDDIPWLIKLAEGNPGKAEDIINNPDFIQRRNDALDNMKFLLSYEKKDVYAFSEFISKNNDDAKDIFGFIISYFRDILALDCRAYDSIINIDKQSTLQKYTGVCNDKKAVRAIEILSEGVKMLDRHVKPDAVALSSAIQIKNTK